MITHFNKSIILFRKALNTKKKEIFEPKKTIQSEIYLGKIKSWLVISNQKEIKVIKSQ